MASARERLLSWLDSRTGYREALKRRLDEPVRGGPSLAYVFGRLLSFVLLNQIVTGILLAAFYSPSAASAWASVAYIQDQVWMGWFIRGMHHAGTTLMVIVMLVHLVQTAVYGAYKAPREVTWLTGVVLAGLVLAFSLTGYLLPWDQKGYWATQVPTTLLGATPVIGPTLQVLVQGGPEYGNLTLTHFYTLHVFVLPAAVLGLTALHVALHRRHGVTPRWGQTEAEIARRTEPRWPRQSTYDLAAMALLFAIMAAWVVRTHGAELTAPADPSVAYDARPEWYFSPLYELRKHFSGLLEFIVAMSAPLLAGGVLVALPFLDRAPTTAPRLRRLPIAVVLGGLLCTVGLGVMSWVGDVRNAKHQKEMAAAQKEAERARELALKGVLPAGGTAVYLNDPQEIGRQLYAEHCDGCHRLGTMGPTDEKDVKGPDLTFWNTRAWLGRFLRDPDGPAFFGKTKIHGMKPYKGPDDELNALVEFVYALNGAQDVNAELRARGEALFGDKNCDTCHEMDGTTEGEGPNLKGRGTAAWVKGLLLKPDAPTYFGEKNDMPAFGKKMSDEELNQLSAFVAAQREVK
jgi:ubiquinol-cytochrome c reductase cytochrome b subunit